MQDNSYLEAIDLESSRIKYEALMADPIIMAIFRNQLIGSYCIVMRRIFEITEPFMISSVYPYGAHSTFHER